MQDDGTTWREHLESLVRSGRKPQSDLDGPGIPDGSLYLWRWFIELDRCRTMNRYGPNPITYAELDAWARLTGRAPEPWEVECLTAMDMAVRSA